MTTCDFIYIDDKIIKCIRCGNTLEIVDNIDEFPIFPCFGVLQDPFKTTLSGAEAIKKEASAMAPDNLSTDEMCSSEQILERYQICGSCEYFENNTCSKCGCFLSRDRIFMSKLSWKEAECPVGKWTKLN